MKQPGQDGSSEVGLKQACGGEGGKEGAESGVEPGWDCRFMTSDPPHRHPELSPNTRHCLTAFTLRQETEAQRDPETDGPS